MAFAKSKMAMSTCVFFCLEMNLDLVMSEGVDSHMSAYCETRDLRGSGSDGGLGDF